MSDVVVEVEKNGTPTVTDNTAEGNQEEVKEVATTKEETQRPSILGNEDLAKEETKEEEKPQEVSFDFSELEKELNLKIDSEKNASFVEVLKNSGITDNKVANGLAKYGVQYALQEMEAYQQERSETLYKESVEAYGGTVDHPSEAYLIDRSKAGIALQALEKHVPGLRQALVESNVDNSVQMLKAFALIGDLVGEDGNLMAGGMGAVKDKITNYPNSDMSQY